jgi:predicted nucleic acid-binding protein
MTANEAFLDTNVLVYALSKDAAKAACAEELLRAGGTISVQVLGEFVDVARRKYAIPWDELVDALDLFERLCDVAAISMETFVLAVELSQRYRLRIFDGMILASAILSGAQTLLTEDMHDGQVIGSVKIRNPFAGL